MNRICEVLAGKLEAHPGHFTFAVIMIILAIGGAIDIASGHNHPIPFTNTCQEKP